MAHAAVTERWLWKEEKMPKIQLFFVKKFSKVGNNNGQLRIANATSGGARKEVLAKNLPSELPKAFQSWLTIDCCQALRTARIEIQKP